MRGRNLGNPGFWGRNLGSGPDPGIRGSGAVFWGPARPRNPGSEGPFFGVRAGSGIGVREGRFLGPRGPESGVRAGSRLGPEMGSGAVFWDLGDLGPSWGPGPESGSGVRGSGDMEMKSRRWVVCGRLHVGDLGICRQMMYVSMILRSIVPTQLVLLVYKYT